MDTRIMTDPEALERLRDELVKLSKAIEEIEFFLKENSEILGQSWQDDKYKEFKDAFDKAVRKCKSISQNYKRWAQGVILPAIIKAREIQMHSTTLEGKESRYLRWAANQSQITAQQIAEGRSPDRPVSYPFFHDGSQEGEYVPLDNTNITPAVRDAVARKQRELAEEARTKLEEELRRQNISDMDKVAQDIENMREKLLNMKDEAEGVVLQKQLEEAMIYQEWLKQQL